jgi:hypothetical protein
MRRVSLIGMCLQGRVDGWPRTRRARVGGMGERNRGWNRSRVPRVTSPSSVDWLLVSTEVVFYVIYTSPGDGCFVPGAMQGFRDYTATTALLGLIRSAERTNGTPSSFPCDHARRLDEVRLRPTSREPH